MKLTRLAYAVVFVCLAVFSLTSPLNGQTNHNRVGLWGGFGLGGGNLGCLQSGCDRIWGFSGNARLGGTPSQYVRLTCPQE